MCSTAKVLSKGKPIHALLLNNAIGGNVNSCYLHHRMYVCCGVLEDAQSSFANCVEQDASSWSVLIKAHGRQGHVQKAVALFQQMQLQGVVPSKFIFVSILSSCSNEAALAEGTHIHARISGCLLGSDVVVGTALLKMYSKCGRLEDSTRLFDEMPHRDAIAWTAMVAAFVQHGRCKDAIQLFDEMQKQGVKEDQHTFVSILSACASLAALAKGRRVHASVAMAGFESDVAVGNALLQMYGKSGSLKDAQSVYNKLPEQDAYSWNAMIAAFELNGHAKEALQLFRHMQHCGVMPDSVTFVILLSICASQVSFTDGKQMHVYIMYSRLDSNIVVGNALVTMYGKCGSPRHARCVFDKMHIWDAFSWNVMIAAYVQNGQGKCALELFGKMQHNGVVPDKISCVSILSVCSSQMAIVDGRWMHKICISGRGFESDVIVGTALLHMYGKCGCLEDAKRTFDKIPEQDIVSWNAMVAAWVQNGKYQDALQGFDEMQQEGVIPDKFTFGSILSACASQAALIEGKRLHACIEASGFESDLNVGKALVNMYGKCGSMEETWRVFEKLSRWDVVSWSVLITGFAQQGQGKKVLQLFKHMLVENVMPDTVIFVSVLSACSHTGLVEEGFHWFFSMIKDYGIMPVLDHYNCMIDLLGRAGRLDEAEHLIHGMPCQPATLSWAILFSACTNLVDVKRGECTASHVFELAPQDTALYVMLANIHARAGRHDNAARLINEMEDKVEKHAGCSSLEAVCA